MRATKYTLAALAFAIATAIGTSRADDVIRRNSHRDLDRTASTISKEARSMRNERDALHAVSVETGIPTPKGQEMLDRWESAGVGGVMIACTLADYSKRDPNYYMERRFHDHQSWDRIVADSGVPFEKVDRKLARLDDYVHSTPNRLPEEHRR
jgi:hypothetical protein